MTHLEFLAGQGLLWIDPEMVRLEYLRRGLVPIQRRWSGDDSRCGWTAAGLPGPCETEEIPPADAITIRAGFIEGFDGREPSIRGDVRLLACANGRAVWERVKDLA